MLCWFEGKPTYIQSVLVLLILMLVKKNKHSRNLKIVSRSIKFEVEMYIYIHSKCVNCVQLNFVIVYQHLKPYNDADEYLLMSINTSYYLLMSIKTD